MEDRTGSERVLHWQVTMDQIIFVCACVCVRVCLCVCVVIPFILDVPGACGRTSRGQTGLLHLPSAVFALLVIFLARRIQPFLSLVDREVEFCVLTNQSFSTWTFFLFSSVRQNPSSCDCTEIRTHVPTSEGFEVTN